MHDNARPRALRAAVLLSDALYAAFRHAVNAPVILLKTRVESKFRIVKRNFSQAASVISRRAVCEIGRSLARPGEIRIRGEHGWSLVLPFHPTFYPRFVHLSFRFTGLLSFFFFFLSASLSLSRYSIEKVGSCDR